MRFQHVLTSALLPALLAVAGGAFGNDLTPQEQLGKSIFFDKNLSINANQSCAACHDPAAGWTGPDADLNALGSVYEGSIPGRFGDRKPPSSAYATPSPILHFVIEKKKDPPLFIGGNFWDGRATGERLGSPAAEQALGPFLNPLEQALPAPAEVVSRICVSSYNALFTQVCGADACSLSDVNAAYDCVGFAIAAYEGSRESNQFSSKYDAYLAGKAKLTQIEKQGLNLFRGKGKCAACHTVAPGPNGEPLLFTDYTFDNLGTPRNPDNPFYLQDTFNPLGYLWLDQGLGGFLASRADYAAYADANRGKQKVPTLRNVDKWDAVLGPKVKAYGHNGYFKSLEQIVHFYNTRDVKPVCADNFTRVEEALAQGCWPQPEVPVNVNTAELGDLKLTAAQEAAIVAFMKTLSDGYFVP
jgi:cytochrome c peroxidase